MTQTVLTALTQTAHIAAAAAFSMHHGLEAMSDISYYYVSHHPNGARQWPRQRIGGREPPKKDSGHSVLGTNQSIPSWRLG